MKKHGYSMNRLDIVAIIRRLDINANNKVSFAEFSNAMSPVEPYFCSQDREASDTKYLSELRERDYLYYPYYYSHLYPYRRYDYPYYYSRYYDPIYWRSYLDYPYSYYYR